MDAKEYFEKEYGEHHIMDVVKMNDLISLFNLMEEYHLAKSKEEAEELRNNTILIEMLRESIRNISTPTA